MSKDIFNRGWYKVPDGHAKSPAMEALQIKSHNLNMFGLYMYLYDMAVQTNGEIKLRDFNLYASKASLTTEQLQSFIDICLEFEVLVANEDNTSYFMPEVQAYLEEAEEQKRKKIEASKQGGLKSAMLRAQANNQNNAPDIESNNAYSTTQANSSDFKNIGHYMPYMGNNQRY